MPWLWCRLAAAAPIQTLAQQLPYVADAAAKRKKLKRKKRSRLITWRTDLGLPRGRQMGGRMGWEIGISRCKLLSIGWINNKVLLYIQHRGRYSAFCDKL